MALGAFVPAPAAVVATVGGVSTQSNGNMIPIHNLRPLQTRHLRFPRWVWRGPGSGAWIIVMSNSTPPCDAGRYAGRHRAYASRETAT